MIPTAVQWQIALHNVEQRLQVVRRSPAAVDAIPIKNCYRWSSFGPLESVTGFEYFFLIPCKQCLHHLASLSRSALDSEEEPQREGCSSTVAPAPRISEDVLGVLIAFKFT